VRFAISMTYSRGKPALFSILVELPQHPRQVLSGELPFEWLRNSLIVPLKLLQSLCYTVQRDEVIGREHLPLNDAEVDLHLIQPTRMYREVHQLRIRPLAPHPFDGRLSTMRGTVVHDPEDPSRRTVRLSAHHIGNKPLKGGNPRLSLAVTEDLGALDVPCSHVGQSTTPLVFMFNPHALAPLSRLRRMNAYACLDAG